MMSYTLHTLKGSPICRCKAHGVGKQMGSQIYMHRMYVRHVVPMFMYREAEKHLPPDFKYETIVFDFKKWTLRFDEAPDFNSAREPHPGVTYTVTREGEVTRRVVNQIWHHKWMWVTEGYKRFSVEGSRNWSKRWLAKVAEVASGHKDKWLQQLQKYGVKG